MKVSIHQPNFLPHLGYFTKIAKSDIFVLLDDVQFTKGGYTNRTKVSNTNTYITVPLVNSSFKKISELEIFNTERFYGKLAKTLKQQYRPWDDILNNILELKFDNLSELNFHLIKAICNNFNIQTKFLKSSTLNIEGKNKNELLIEIIKRVGGEIYLSNKSIYLDENLFQNSNIKIEYFDSLSKSNGMSIITNEPEFVRETVDG